MVLVVDDDRNLRTIIGTNLELAGFDVMSAADGPTALALLDDHLPDVVVLDVMMPLMDGYATLGTIRRHATARTCRSSCSPAATRSTIR